VKKLGHVRSATSPFSRASKSGIWTFAILLLNELRGLLVAERLPSSARRARKTGSWWTSFVGSSGGRVMPISSADSRLLDTDEWRL